MCYEYIWKKFVFFLKEIIETTAILGLTSLLQWEVRLSILPWTDMSWVTHINFLPWFLCGLALHCVFTRHRKWVKSQGCLIVDMLTDLKKTFLCMEILKFSSGTTGTLFFVTSSSCMTVSSPVSSLGVLLDQHLEFDLVDYWIWE